MRGRPKVLDETKRAEICAVLAVGGSQQMAARYVGVSVATIRRAAKRDAEFAQSLAKAVAQHELSQLRVLDRAGRSERYWRAAAWKLERADPEHYRLRRHDGVTPQQLSQVLEEFGDALTKMVPQESSARELRDQLGEITRRLRRMRAGDE